MSERTVAGAELVQGAAALRERALTPEQVERRRVVAARQLVIQAGVKQPASGVFGRLKAVKA